MPPCSLVVVRLTDVSEEHIAFIFRAEDGGYKFLHCSSDRKCCVADEVSHLQENVWDVAALRPD